MKTILHWLLAPAIVILILPSTSLSQSPPLIGFHATYGIYGLANIGINGPGNYNSAKVYGIGLGYERQHGQVGIRISPGYWQRKAETYRYLQTQHEVSLPVDIFWNPKRTPLKLSFGNQLLVGVNKSVDPHPNSGRNTSIESRNLHRDRLQDANMLIRVGISSEIPRLFGPSIQEIGFSFSHAVMSDLYYENALPSENFFNNRALYLLINLRMHFNAPAKFWKPPAPANA